MTPKEKAKYLVGLFEYELTEQAKQYALILANEVSKSNVVWYVGSIPYKYWENVKKEIKKL
jgi:hypothetical protein